MFWLGAPMKRWVGERRKGSLQAPAGWGAAGQLGRGVWDGSYGAGGVRREKAGGGCLVAEGGGAHGSVPDGGR